MKKFLLSSLLCLTAWVSQAYYPFVKNYQREAYRAGTQTWAIAQVPGGGMIFANNDGVLSFDGEDWGLTRLNNRTSARSLYYDSTDACLYVGGTNELGRIAFTDRGPVYTSLLDSLGVYLNEIWDIGRDASGRLWFADNSTRYYLPSGPAGLPQPDRGPSSSPGLTGGLLREPYARYKLPGKVFCVAENAEYTAEGTSGDGIWIRSKAPGGGTIHLTTENGLQNNSILCLFFDRDGGLWAGTDHGIDYVMLNFPIWSLFGDSANFGGGYAICRSGGWLYLGTNLGLFRVRESRMGLSLGDGDFTRVPGVEGQVWSLHSTGEDVIACCDRGVYICRNGNVTGYVPTDGAWKVEPLQGHPGKLLGCSYTRFFILEKRGGSWGLGAWLGGFDEAGKAFEQDTDGRIWFAHHVKGLYRLTLSKDLRSVELSEKFGSAQGFPTDRGNYPGEYRGMIVFSTEGGFYSFDNTTGQAHPVDELNLRFSGTPNSLLAFETPLGTMRYYSSGAMQAVEYRSDGGSTLDSLSLRSLINHRPVGFECIGSLGERSLLLNTDEGFVVLELDRLLRSSANSSGAVYISGVQVADGGELLHSGFQPIGRKGAIRIPHKQNSLVFNYIAPVFDSFLPTEYSVMLKGYDKQFSAFSPESSRQYSRIPSGRYTFIVKARNPMHGGGESTASIEILVQRPWTGSLTAWILYIIIGAMLAFLAVEFFDSVASRKARRIADKEAEKMRQEQIRKDLKAKADDLAASTASLQRKNELLQQIASKVDDAVESAKRGDAVELRLKRLRGISELIRENITHENDWQKFQDNFDVVYDDFLKRLGAEFPVLSQNDKRICAYLRMGLSSKDIAPLLGMTVRSVEMTRYRIRQKLSLSRDSNLTDFLQRY